MSFPNPRASMAGLLPCVPRVTGAACGQSLALRSLSQFPAARGSFYDVLEVSPSATQDEVKAAYYKLSKSHHPDMKYACAGAQRNRIA